MTETEARHQRSNKKEIMKKKYDYLLLKFFVHFNLSPKILLSTYKNNKNSLSKFESATAYVHLRCTSRNFGALWKRKEKNITKAKITS